MKKSKFEFHRLEILWNLGEKLHMIEDYPEKLWKEINKHYYCGTPLNVLLQEGFNIGKCYDRSYALTMAFEKCNLVRGLLPRYGKLENTSYDQFFNHGWVEDDKYVYDTTFMKRFNKKFYYYLFGAKAEKIISSDELNKDDYYQNMKNTTKEDIENSIGIDASNAWLVNKILEQREVMTGRDLSYLRCNVPKIDLEEINRKQDKRIREMIENNEREY